MGHGGTVIEELMTDHREVEEIFGRVTQLAPGDEKRRLYADQATIELVRHSVAEETHLYPAVRAHVPGGEELAEKELEDHAGAERLMKELEGADVREAEFDRTLGALMEEIRAHVDDEERNLFPRLREAVSVRELQELGEKVRQAKKTAPTRPHPSVPNEPLSSKVLAPGLGLVDRTRDLLTGRGKQP